MCASEWRGFLKERWHVQQRRAYGQVVILLVELLQFQLHQLGTREDMFPSNLHCHCSTKL